MRAPDSNYRGPRVWKMSDSDAVTVVRRFWESVWNEGNVGALDELFHPAVHENGEALEIAQFRNAVVSLRTSFPDFKVTIEELIPLGADRVVSRVTFRGTHRGNWAGLPASGRSFEVIGIDIFTVEAGQVTALWHSTDHYVIATQLGATMTSQ